MSDKFLPVYNNKMIGDSEDIKAFFAKIGAKRIIFI